MFKRKVGFIQGVQDLKILNAQIVCYNNGYEAIKLTVVNKSGVIGTLNIFLNNTYLVDTLLYIVYGNISDDEFDEKDLIGVIIVVELKENKGYFYINDIKDAYIEGEEEEVEEVVINE